MSSMKNYWVTPSSSVTQYVCSLCTRLSCCSIAKFCPTLCDPWTVAHQAPLSMGFPRQEWQWVAISFCKGSFWIRDWTHVSCIGRWIIYHWATREGHPSTAKWPKKMWHSYIMEYYTATERSQTVPFAETWMSLGTAVPSEVSLKDKNKHILTHICRI